jgi:Xaa-Pro aminopeptidase
LNRAERLARLLRVLAAIISEPGLNPLELAEKAGVSDRTLRRDLAQLRDLGYEVAYTSGYEVQEKLNLEGRSRQQLRARGDDALLQAVAHAVETAGLWRETSPAASVSPRRRARRSAVAAPLVLIPSGEADAEFIYASGMAVESALYIRFAPGDDLIVAGSLEIDRARAESRAGRKLSLAEAGYEELGPYKSAAAMAAKLLRERGQDQARVSARLQAGYLEAMRAEGVEVEIDHTLFEAERMRKTPAEANHIRAAQQAAEAALTEIVRLLSQAQVRDGMLWTDGRPMTSEWLVARGSLVLGEMGFACPDMIVAGSPENAMPHYRGEGQIRASAPVVIDIFPTGRTSHYHGDLTRTVVVGDVPDEIRRMHAATLQALDAAIETIQARVPASDVHHTVCQVLVDRGYGTTTAGYEGQDGGPKMNHTTGHGVGLDVHEPPGLRGPNHEPLEDGNVVTVEPGLYLMGLGGVRIEDTGMVTASGFDNFTSITRSLDPKDYL